MRAIARFAQTNKLEIPAVADVFDLVALVDGVEAFVRSANASRHVVSSVSRRLTFVLYDSITAPDIHMCHARTWVE